MVELERDIERDLKRDIERDYEKYKLEMKQIEEEFNSRLHYNIPELGELGKFKTKPKSPIHRARQRAAKLFKDLIEKIIKGETNFSDITNDVSDTSDTSDTSGDSPGGKDNYKKIQKNIDKKMKLESAVFSFFSLYSAPEFKKLRFNITVETIEGLMKSDLICPKNMVFLGMIIEGFVRRDEVEKAIQVVDKFDKGKINHDECEVLPKSLFSLILPKCVGDHESSSRTAFVKLLWKLRDNFYAKIKSYQTMIQDCNYEYIIFQNGSMHVKWIGDILEYSISDSYLEVKSLKNGITVYDENHEVDEYDDIFYDDDDF